MRPLNEEERKKFFDRLDFYSIKFTIEEEYDLYLLKKKICYFNNALFKSAIQYKNENIFSAGTIVGKFTKHEKIFLHLPLFQLSNIEFTNKIIIKRSAENNVLYNNEIKKCHIEKIGEIESNSGCLLFNVDDLFLGFGLLLRSAASFNKIPHSGKVIVLHGDNGEYLRSEGGF